MPRSSAHSRRPDCRAVAVKIVQTLRREHHIAYFAGGCVRDRLLGQAPKDYDVATDAPPERVRSLFRRSQYVGQAFGVVLVHLYGYHVEVATFRSEADYEDGRHPSRVAFCGAEEDAQRRDFTVNGLFEDPIAQRIVDYVGGRRDLTDRVIRAIGDPQSRFSEDYLRMLRAVRFAAALGFRIERRTAMAIRRHGAKLAQISRERIGQEVTQMLSGPRPAVAAELLQRFALDAPVLRGATIPSRLPTLAKLDPGSSYAAALAGWALDRHVYHGFGRTVSLDQLIERLRDFVDSELGPIVRQWRSALCMSNDQTKAFRQTLTLLGRALGWASLSTPARKRLVAHEAWSDTWRIMQGLRMSARKKLITQLTADIRQLVADGVKPPPLVSGDDLIKMGQKPGPAFGRLLTMVYDAQLAGLVQSHQEALHWLEQHL